MDMMDVDSAQSATMRRRKRRLRQVLRHERLSVAIVLGEGTHHNAPRRPKQAQVWGGGSRDELHGDGPDASSLPGGKHSAPHVGR